MSPEMKHVMREEKSTKKEPVVDPDTILTAEEEKLLEESYKEQKEGKLLSSAELRKELGI